MARNITGETVAVDGGQHIAWNKEYMFQLAGRATPAEAAALRITAVIITAPAERGAS